MIEYCIETKLARVHISDINVVVIRGTPAWVTEEQWQRSIVLREIGRAHV